MPKIGKTLDSREVAQMVGKDHHKLLRDIHRYVEQLGESKIGYSDFFKEFTYRSEQNKEMPCYLITKKGCEFIAHKLTGTKGTEFTARYINRFHEMESELQERKPLPEESLSGIGKILEVMERTMETQNADPHDTARVMKSILNQFGIRVPREFTSTRPALPSRCGASRKNDIIHLIGKIDDSVFLFRIYVSLREYIKEKEA